MVAAPADRESPEEEVWTADAGVRPTGRTRLDGLPDDKLRLPALPAPSRDKSAAEGVAVVPPFPPGIVLSQCALVLPPLLLPRLRILLLYFQRGCEGRATQHRMRPGAAVAAVAAAADEYIDGEEVPDVPCAACVFYV